MNKATLIPSISIREAIAVLHAALTRLPAVSPIGAALHLYAPDYVHLSGVQRFSITSSEVAIKVLENSEVALDAGNVEYHSWSLST